MQDITVVDWWNNLGTAIQPAFNSTAMLVLGPAQVIFGAAVAYRKAQEDFNNGTSVTTGAYLNFASPIIQDSVPSLDNAGDISSSSRITLLAKTVYAPNPQVEPQESITII